MSTFDIGKAKRETRAADGMIHFNNAGSSMMPSPVADALYAYLQKEELIGGYETAAAEKDALDNFYIASAKLLNCDPDEIAFIENATRAWDMAFYSFRFEPGDKIVTSISEYGSNVIAMIQQAKRYGAEVVFVPDDEYGQLDIVALENLLDENVKLIAISHIPTGGGLVNPAAAVGKVANKAGIPYLLDSCQGVGQLSLDVQAIGCDMLSGTGRKFLRGPRGTGLLYVRREFAKTLEPVMLDQHAATLVSATEYTVRDDVKKFENWEQNFAGKVALGVAIDYALEWGLEAIQERVYELSADLRAKLSAIDGVTVADGGAEKCGLVTFMTQQKDAEAIKTALAVHRINVTVSDGSGSFVSFEKRGIKALVRASLHYFNDVEEIDRFIDVLKTILAA
ncbi:MAG: cysteine desulfurase/selenocysteine lyase [Cellvibrionaceae bacterium]|jgi:cysteine desulfurase/selenocysteine lyase